MSKRKNAKNANGGASAAKNTVRSTDRNSDKETATRKSSGRDKPAAPDAVVTAPAEAGAAAADKAAALATSSRKAIARAAPVASGAKSAALKSAAEKPQQAEATDEPPGPGKSQEASAPAMKDVEPTQIETLGKDSPTTEQGVVDDRTPKNSAATDVADAAVDKPARDAAPSPTQADSPTDRPDPAFGSATEPPREKTAPFARNAFAAPSERVQAYRQLMLDAAKADFDFNMALGTRLATMRSPFDLFTVAAEFSGRRLGMINDFSKAVVDLAAGRPPKT